MNKEEYVRYAACSFRRHGADMVAIRILSSVEIMRTIVDRIGCKLNVFNEDGVYRRDRWQYVATVGS